ncbi:MULTISPECIES: MarR family winged helix-turn-helix transcriptional regulator [unclassified Kitasatospora]|uniref:MarR family winged helix-turn-helix transcriptional regulator n=1 Tax=unclassified Kitasatospora TaxID=2633591 RepID=UPI00070F170A|nr:MULTISPECIES: MarR family transcriptional regulator [unclassified Kitasatospora]KQV23691.1 MarR family transcriptional regulator [Kitasatospora sp. Root107]KRB67597.1 MarR family transcriptional regulator [Kitasatospora sp. Root187]
MDTPADTPAAVSSPSSSAEGETPWLSAKEQQFWRAHLEVSHLLDYQLGRELQPHGLANNDYEILVVLSESPDRRMRMTDLATATLQSKSRLSHQITRMENAGLVLRQECPGDRRGLYAHLTEHGWDILQKVAPDHVRSVRHHFIDRFTPEQIDTLYAALAPVADHLRSLRGRS